MTTSMMTFASCLNTPDADIEREDEKRKARSSVDPHRVITACTDLSKGSKMLTKYLSEPRQVAEKHIMLKLKDQRA